MKRLLTLPLLALMLVPMGCKKTATVNPAALEPGAYNQVDQDLYRGLMTAQAALNSLKATIAQTPQLKTAINQAITDYNAAEAAWQVYHVALATNSQTSPAVAQATLQRVQTDLSTIATEAK